MEPAPATADLRSCQEASVARVEQAKKGVVGEEVRDVMRDGPYRSLQTWLDPGVMEQGFGLNSGILFDMLVKAHPGCISRTDCGGVRVNAEELF